MSKETKEKEAAKAAAPKAAVDKISTEVREISQRLKEAIKLDPTTGTAPKESTEGLYVAEAERHGISLDQLKTVHDFQSDFVAGASLAVGELAIEGMKKHKKLDSVTVSIPTVGAGAMTAYMPRETTGRNPTTGEAVVSHGRLSVDWKTGIGERRGQMNHVLTHLKDVGQAALGNK